MQWPDAPKGGVGRIEVEDRVEELNGCDKPYKHPHYTEYHRGNHKILDNLVVVSEALHACIIGALMGEGFLAYHIIVSDLLNLQL